MQDRPNADELAVAVQEFLEREVLPAVGDARLQFRVRVAANALGILAREIAAGDAATRAEATETARLLGGEAPGAEVMGAALAQAVRALRGTLAARIRAGDAPEGTRALLARLVAGKLAVASPRYLARVVAEAAAPSRAAT